MTTHAIQIQQLQFGYGKQAVVDIELLYVEPGERIFVHGASGSGKSTLLALIGGVLLPQRGQLRVLDTELTTLTGAQRDQFRADHIGFMFQMYNLLPYLSLLDNVILPARFSSQRAPRASRRHALHDEARRLLAALGLSEAAMHTRNAAQLSQGQQQRVAAARALFGNPDLLIADEPTSALDADARDDFLQLLLSECAQRHTTLLFVNHDRSLQHRFDRSVDMQSLSATQPEGPALHG